MNWIAARLRENSTWRGIVWLMTVAGLSLRPDQADAIITLGMAVAGLLGVFTSDQPQNVHLDPAPALPPIELVSRHDSQPRPATDRTRDALPTDRGSSSAATADPNPPPNFTGFGDRD